jgi:hypothetical protein
LVVRQFLTRDGVIASGGFGTGVYRDDSQGFYELDQFRVIGKDPQPSVKAGEAGTHGDGTTRGATVESGRGSGGGR